MNETPDYQNMNKTQLLLELEAIDKRFKAGGIVERAICHFLYTIVEEYLHILDLTEQIELGKEHIAATEARLKAHKVV